MSIATKTPKVAPKPATESAKPLAEKAVKTVKPTTKSPAKPVTKKNDSPVTNDTPVTATAANPTAKTATKKKSLSATEQAPSFTPYQTVMGEEYMSDDQLAHFKSLLLNWKEELLDEAESTKSYIQDESTAMPDINDRATQEEEFALALRTRDRERKLIRKIDKSLADMESGDYGFCHTCGVEIGIRRLEARPTATQCIDCKTLAEMKEKQAWGHI